MALNKIQQKAAIFKLLEPLAKNGAFSDSLVNKILSEINKIKGLDYEFASKILIKEANYKKQKVSAAYLYIAEELSPESFISFIMTELNSNSVSDNQKFFFINVLSSFGFHISPEDVGVYLSNPDETINKETIRFLEKAKVDPEAQIDFLDFYFSSSDEDKLDLVNSVISDFEGDKLANIISPLALSAYDTDIVNICLDALDKTSSVISAKTFYYLSHSKDENISSHAKKSFRKMVLKGIYSEQKAALYNKNILKDLKEPVFRISYPDGNSNFTIVVSREKKDGTWHAMFTAFNIESGPFSCFGFSSISKEEYETVIKRFFAEQKPCFIKPEAGKKIMRDLTIERIKQNKNIPYEYFCWERITDDIIPSKLPLDTILKEGLKEIKISPVMQKLIDDSPFFHNWFFRYSKNNPQYTELVDKIMSLDIKDLNKTDVFVKLYAKDKTIQKTITKRIVFLSFVLKNMGAYELANMYYSLLFYCDEFELFICNILKRSIYEHMLFLKMPVKKNNMFQRHNKGNQDKDILPYINFIEKNWVK